VPALRSVAYLRSSRARRGHPDARLHPTAVRARRACGISHTGRREKRAEKAGVAITAPVACDRRFSVRLGKYTVPLSVSNGRRWGGRFYPRKSIAALRG